MRNVTKLIVLSIDLIGSISPNIGSFKALIRLWLGDNKLSGEIQNEVGKLENLDFLDMADNQFTGTLFPDIGGCTAL